MFSYYGSYHIAGIGESILRKFCIGVVDKPSQSYYDWSSEFYPTLKKRVLESLGDTPRRGGLGNEMVKYRIEVLIFCFL